MHDPSNLRCHLQLSMRHVETYGLRRVVPYACYVPDGIRVSTVESLSRRLVPAPYERPVGRFDLRLLESPQYTTSISQPSLESVTITHPHHPLHGQRCEIVRIRRGVDPDLILRLADGSHAAIAMSWTDYGEPQGLPAAPSRPDLPQLDLQGLRQIVHLLDQLRQEDRFPTPRRRAPRSRSVHRKLPKVNTGSLRSD
jgi:hypothetical protein